MKARTTLCALMCILVPLSTQALPTLTQLFPCLKKHMHKKVIITQIPTPTLTQLPTLAQRCLIMSKKIAQSKITKATVATIILCICAKKVWNYIQSLRTQLRSTSDQLRAESTRKQELEQQITEQNQQTATQAEQLTQAQRQVQEQQQEAGRLAEHVGQLQQQAALSEKSHKVQLQNTHQALEALQVKINKFPLRATEKLNVHAQRLTALGQRLQQLKDALAHKVKATRSSSTQTGKSSSKPSSHLVRAQGRYAPQPLSTEQDSRIHPKIKQNIPHFHNSRHCAACEEKKQAQKPTQASK
ncbi:MAG TPA: hypothetical protein PKD74_00170 [Candidatus Dependentiae bacterium]|jgi:septal ring factor EnvC (AmiA/AmiB activator)|nr:hypothetical protein [Candidatus Dependentiae bacterium]